ncbi:MAG: sugar ABC transporter ATP-binding protein, partial [Spirochaetales bacterium]|nr:sugar ABC transporter ATP-binding protein [Spirochaetales bacterium]
MGSLIECTNVTKRYPGVRALDGVNFALERGEVHCLVGENGSGKSTLIKIISGVVQPDHGSRVVIDGREAASVSARDAIDHGVRVIYQDLALFPNLTVRENIAFGLYGDTPGPLVSWKAIRSRAREAMSMIGLELDPDRSVSSLSIAEQQQVEIARSIVGDLKLLILDEPTASLTRREVDRLFATIALLRSRGIATLFVSHKLNEIFEIAERVTVFRDGRSVGTYRPDELHQKKLIHLMTGREVVTQPPPPLPVDARELLRVDGLSKKNNYRDVSLTLREGEILGITGRLGSGRTELALTLFGMNPPDSGTVYVAGSTVKLDRNGAAMRAGIACVPENRLTQGLVMAQSILSNMTVAVLPELLNALGLLDGDRAVSLAEGWVERLAIRVPDITSAVETLSGGNQQKIVLSKWLATQPKVLILDEPTVG